MGYEINKIPLFDGGFGLKIMVTTVENTHFINEIKLKEKPFRKHWTTQ